MADEASLVDKTQETCSIPCLGLELRIVFLREVHEFFVVAETRRDQLGMGTQTKPFDDQSVEMPHKIVRQEIALRIRLQMAHEGFNARVESIAVWSRQTGNVAFLCQNGIEGTAGAAVSIGHENVGIAFVSCLTDAHAHPFRDPLRCIVPFRRQAVQIDAVPMLSYEKENIPCQCPAGDDEAASFLRLFL